MDVNSAPSRYDMRCPGVDEHDDAPTATTVHMDGCCARFAALPADEQQAVGLRVPATGDPRPAGRAQAPGTIPTTAHDQPGGGT